MGKEEIKLSLFTDNMQIYLEAGEDSCGELNENASIGSYIYTYIYITVWEGLGV